MMLVVLKHFLNHLRMRGFSLLLRLLLCISVNCIKTEHLKKIKTEKTQNVRNI